MARSGRKEFPCPICKGSCGNYEWVAGCRYLAEPCGGCDGDGVIVSHSENHYRLTLWRIQELIFKHLPEDAELPEWGTIEPEIRRAWAGASNEKQNLG